MNMPKIGEMVEAVNSDGEIFYNADTGIKEIRKMRIVANDKQSGDGAPEYLVKIGAREMGAMWACGDDRKGNPYFKLKINGYPMPRTLWLMAFFEEQGRFALDYSAPNAAKAAESEAA